MLIECNEAHSKGLPFYRKEKGIEHMSCTEMKTTEFKLFLITEHAKREKSTRFTSIAHLLDVDYLRNGFKSLNRNKAKGVDDVSWYDYNANLEENLEKLVERLKKKSFRPIPAKRVYISKSDGKRRPLGIPAIESKIVELGIKKILSHIYEEDFSNQSFGFRPERSCHDALKEANRLITFNPTNHIVEADIKGFFDNVSHEILLEFLKRRIADNSMLMLIEKFLKAGYMEEGVLVRTDKGTPQGSIISPILANVFLHYVLDEWFEKTVKKHTRGFCELVRYADDFICMIQYKDDAIRIEKALKNRFGRFYLEIHPEKSKRISFGRYEVENAKRENRRANVFTFLGFTHFCTKTRKGRFKVGRKTAKKKFAAACKALKEWLRNNRCMGNAKDFWSLVASKLRGHYQYYGVSENSKAIGRFYHVAIGYIFKWFNRRSQRRSMNWKNFKEYLSHYPLPKPSIKCSFYI